MESDEWVLNDYILIDTTNGGNMAVFKDVYETYGKKVYRFLLSLTGDENLSEELLQETFYQVLLHIDRFEGRSSIYTWICQIAKNTWVKELKRRRKFSAYQIQEESLVDEFSMEDEIIRQEQLRMIREAVKKLEEPYREVFILHVYGEVKLREIAGMYEKSESWAKVTYLRAKAKILKEIER